MSKLYWGAGAAALVALTAVAAPFCRPEMVLQGSAYLSGWNLGRAAVHALFDKTERVFPTSAKETQPPAACLAVEPVAQREPETPAAATVPNDIYVWGESFPEMTAEESAVPECPEKDCCKNKTCCGENGCKSDKSCCAKNGCCAAKPAGANPSGAECCDENEENGWFFDLFHTVLRNASNAVTNAAAVVAPPESAEGATEESEMKDNGQAPDCTESPDHDYRYPGCPYIGSSSRSSAPSAAPRTGDLPKTKKDEMILAPVPDEVGGAEESEAAPKRKPSLDTMEFRQDDDAKSGEFDQKPMR